MAQAKRKTEWNAARQAATPAVERALPGTPSPARALQQLLQERAGIIPGEVRWSRRRSLSVIVSLSATLWATLLVISHTAMIVAA